MHLQQHADCRRFTLEEPSHTDHGDLDDVAGRALNRSVDDLPNRGRANGEEVAVDLRQISASTEQRLHIPVFLSTTNNAVLVRLDGAEALEIPLNEARSIRRWQAGAFG